MPSLRTCAGEVLASMRTRDALRTAECYAPVQPMDTARWNAYGMETFRNCAIERMMCAICTIGRADRTAACDPTCCTDHRVVWAIQSRMPRQRPTRQWRRASGACGRGMRPAGWSETRARICDSSSSWVAAIVGTSANSS